MDEELAFVAESHAPIINTPTMDVMDNGDFDPYTVHLPKVPARSKLRVNIHSSPPIPIPPPPNVTSGNRLSPISTSESDGDGTQNSKVTSLSSFHLPNRTRTSFYRDRGPETPPLTSPSHSSLNSSSAISQISALHTPPHSPPAHSFVFTESNTPSSHLSVISEVNTPEDPVIRLSHRSAPAKSTQTLQPFAWTDRPSSSSSAPAEGEGQVVITPRSMPRRLETHVYLSEAHSPTGTVTNALLNAAAATTTTTTTTTTTSSPSVSDLLTPTTAATMMLCPPSTPSSPSRSSFSTQSSGGGGGGSSGGGGGVISWPFANANKSRTTIVAPLTKTQKAQEKRRKKEEARMRKERLALELRRRTEAQRAKADNASMYTARSAEKHTWEEDIAMFGGLASM
jgi:hypothetical protein